MPDVQNQTPQETILVDGSTGYLGNHLIAELREKGFAVRALAHRGAADKDISFLKSLGADVHVADLDDQNGPALDKAFDGVGLAYHLIGSVAPARGQSLVDLHGKQSEDLVKKCQKHGVKKIVAVTALGTNSDANNNYHKTKWLIEEAVKASGLRFAILRPSLVVGRKVGTRDSKLVKRYIELIKTRPAVPLIGGGKFAVQPVFVADLAKALAACALSDSADGVTAEIGGSEVMSMKTFVESLMQTLSVTKKTYGVPAFAASMAAMFFESGAGVPLISQDQVKLASCDNICTNNRLESTFGIRPTPVSEALSTYKGV